MGYSYETMRCSRRLFLGQTGLGIGAAALASLLGTPASAGESDHKATGSLPGLPHHLPWAKRVIFLCQSGAPSQIELFDYKPALAKRHGQEIPESIRAGQRLTTMTSDQASKPLTASAFKFAQHGQSGAWLSELLPHTARVADELCFVRSLHTEAINHDPGITFLQTGSQQPGRPSFGSWVSYGLGTMNADLPAFVVMISGGGKPGDQPLYGRLWDSAFLPAQHQGVKFRAGGDPVLYLSNPPGIDRAGRRRMLDALAQLHQLQHERDPDPAIVERIEQYEMAFRMQAAVPELADLSQESAATFDLYGPDAKTPGTYAANCLLARRLVERGVRFVQLYHRDWDHHAELRSRLPDMCRQTDQASAALVSDLKQRGLLDETLVVWAGEFGRTSFCQGELTGDYGRDHHPRCFAAWLAGGGIKPGVTYGRTDEFSYNVVENPVHLHDLQATLLHLLGIDHTRLIHRFQGRDFRLTDIAGEVVQGILS